MLYLSYGQSALFGVLQETVGDVRQGGVFKFPLKFESGICRARFSPIDGQLYVAGLKGWQTNAIKDGAIHRVRYTGRPVTVPSSLEVTDQGILIRFAVASLRGERHRHGQLLGRTIQLPVDSPPTAPPNTR